MAGKGFVQKSVRRRKNGAEWKGLEEWKACRQVVVCVSSRTAGLLDCERSVASSFPSSPLSNLLDDLRRVQALVQGLLFLLLDISACCCFAIPFRQLVILLLSPLVRIDRLESHLQLERSLHRIKSTTGNQGTF